MPAPKHITDLMNKILSESPDRPLRGSYDSETEADEKLESIGLDPKVIKRLAWSDTEAVTFAIDGVYHVVMWVANSADQRAFQHADMDDLFTGGLRDSKVDKGVVGMDWKKYRQLALWHRDFFNSGERTNRKMMMGRLWRENRFVSFWNKKDDVMREWTAIENFITNMGLDPRKCVYEFIDKLDVELYDEVHGKESASVEPSAEEIAALHVKTDGGVAKKKALGDIGKYRSAESQLSRIGDGVVKNGNLLKEDPDRIITDKGERWQYNDPDANTFVYRPQDGLLFRARTGKHGKTQMFHSDMLNIFGSIGSVFKNDSIDREDGGSDKITTVDQFNDYSDMLELGIMWRESDGLIRVAQHGWNVDIQCFGGTGKMIKFFESLVEQQAEDGFSDPKFRMQSKTIGILGRYWEDTEVSSFWLNKRDLGRLILKGALDLYFDYMGIDKGNARLNAIDKNSGIFTVEDAKLAAGAKPTMSKADVTDAMSRPHFGKGNKNMAGDKDVEDIKREKEKKISNYQALQNSPLIRKRSAEYNALMPALEEQKIITEDPDTVMDPYRDDRGLCFWKDRDATAFFAFPTCCAISNTGDKVDRTHPAIWGGLRQCYREQSLAPTLKKYSFIKFNSNAEMLKQLKSGLIGSAVKKDLSGSDFKPKYDIPNTLAGRIWSDKKIISFWNDQQTVITNWKNIELMFRSSEFGFGNLNDYQIDWIEREHDGRGMTPASKLSSKLKDADDNTEEGFKKLLFKIFSDPSQFKKLDAATLKKIQERLHLLDPEDKKKAMEILGMRTAHTASEIADKLGMTVAEFNHIMHVNESVTNTPTTNSLMFHVTMSGRAKNIAKNGLRCNSKRSIGAPSLDGNCKGRIFLTDVSGLDFWFDRAELFARDNADDFLEEGWVPFVLQVNVDGLTLERDIHGSTDSRHSAMFAVDAISPDRIRAWDGSGWILCSEIQNIDFSQAIDDDEYEDFLSPSPLFPTI